MNRRTNFNDREFSAHDIMEMAFLCNVFTIILRKICVF